MARVKPASRFPQRPAPASWPNNISISNHRVPSSHISRAIVQHRRRDPSRAAASKEKKTKQRVAKLKAARLRARANKKAARLAFLGITEDDIDWTKFQQDWSAHIHLCHKWVQTALLRRRFNTHVAEELKEYYTARKTHWHFAPTYLSGQMKSAVKSCELELGTDVEWARKASRGWGKWGPKVVGMIEDIGEDEAFRGVSPLWDVGESDLESDVGEDGRWGDDGGWRDVMEGEGERGEALEYAEDVSSLFPDGGDHALSFGDEHVADDGYALPPQWTGDDLGDIWPAGGDADYDFGFDFESTAIDEDAALSAGDADVDLDIDLFA
ncbi:hypothetical protein N7G274_004445 [Stereocaulon virgatum]|uniref:Uncharacterized protein n=1 Tax=Stereocaulon virgatum TaxID=373712 RepID=A0ABR4AB65_9LECA